MRSHPLAIACAFVLFPFLAHADSVTIYGIADVFLEAANAGKGTALRVESGGIAQSRLGFTGDEDLGGGLKAIFTLESGFAMDTGSSGAALFSRQSFAGLSSRDWGTLTLGHQETPLFLTTYAFDAFGLGTSGNYWNLSQYANFWVDNVAAYETPVIGGLSVRLFFAPSEKASRVGRYSAGSLNYTQGKLNLVASFDQQEISDQGAAARHATAGGSYDFGVLKLYAGVESVKNADPVEPANHDARLATLGLRVPMTAAGAAVASVTHRDDRADSGRDATQWAFGWFQSLSKRTTLYGTYGWIHKEPTAPSGSATTPFPGPRDIRRRKCSSG